MIIIDVRSRVEIESNVYDANIISITSEKEKANILNSGPTLFLFFDDIEDESIVGYIPIQQQDVNAIVKFVNDNKTNGKHFVVNCDAGISRSAGVAAAISKFLNNDDSNIFNNKSFCPNMTCYRMVLNGLIKGAI